MAKFDPLEYKRRQIHKALRCLSTEDGFSKELLADLAGKPVGTFYSYVHEDYDSTKEMPASVLSLLTERLAKEWKNYRLVFLNLPGSDSVVHAEMNVQANGIEDEVDEAVIRAGELAAAKRAGDPDAAEKTAASFEELAPRIREECRVWRAMKQRVSVDGHPVGVTVYAPGGPPSLDGGEDR